MPWIRIFTLLVFLSNGIVTQLASGNGGGYRYGVKFTGGVAPFEPSGVKHVQIMDEKLSVVLDQDRANVEVRYVMKNITDRRARVTFGFPIEANGTDPYESDSYDSIKRERRSKTEVEALVRNTQIHFSDYEVRVGGKILNHRHLVEPFATGAVKAFPGSEILDGVVGWMVSTLVFSAGEERQVTIRYQTAYDHVGGTVSDDIYHRPPVFRYRLSTGGVWAGPIVKGRVQVKFSDAMSRWTEIKKPAGPFKRDGDDADAWVWNFENLEPTLADDIEIVTGPDGAEYQRGSGHFVREGDRWHLSHQNFTAVASSTLKPQSDFNYVATNVLGYDWIRDDRNHYHAWSEGVPGDGIGETLTLTVEKPLTLDALRIHPGYGKSDVLFNANGRPAQLKITLNGEHTFSANLKDRNEKQRIPIKGYTKPVETVGIELTQVFSGEKYSDTCISDIRLISHLDKKPKFQGAR